ncbi:MAG: septal ring lytic transglycosylase RlpA family protein [Dongiaceae bacterium]
MLAALALAGCAETTFVVDQSKVVSDDPGTSGSTVYKIGQPYQIGGVWYYPKVDYGYDQSGIASWYGPGFDGKQTATGEIYDENALTAAHQTLPMPTLVRITNLENGRAIELRINDRGPFANGRIIDVSRRAAQLLGFENAGTARVRVQVLEDESRQMAARLSGAPGSDDVQQPVPEAAPSVAVVAQPLPDSTGSTSTTPVPASPTPAVTTTATATPLPEPTGQVFQQPVRATAIYIQAGAFVDVQNAERLRVQLSGLSTTSLFPVRVGEQQFYRVRMGPIASVEQADALLARVIAQGHDEARIVVD